MVNLNIKWRGDRALVLVGGAISVCHVGPVTKTVTCPNCQSDTPDQFTGEVQAGSCRLLHFQEMIGK